MIKKNIAIERDINYRNIESEPSIIQAEKEKEDSEPSIFKQNYGWMTLGGAFIILSITLLILLIKSKESVALMVTFIILCFAIGAALLILPPLLTKYRLCSIPLIEAMGNDVFNDFHYLTTDNTLDHALKISFGEFFYDKLTEKKELEVLKGIDKERKFTTYDFVAKNESISTAPSQIEGTLIRIAYQTNAKGVTYCSTSAYADLFTPMEKLPIGGDSLIFFGSNKEELENIINLRTIEKMNLDYMVSVDSEGVSILLIGKTMDIKKIKKAKLDQSLYNSLSNNFNPLILTLDSLN